jgi:predicted peptidase
LPILAVFRVTIPGMKTLLLTTVLLTLVPPQPALAQSRSRTSMTNTVFQLPDGFQMTYGIALPADDDENPDDPRPLVLALHPGGSSPYYGTSFMRRVVEPALRPWRAIIVAPDVPARRWSNERSEQAVLALLEDVMANHSIDPRRILVTGFSMGGRGTWFLATRHSDLFTGAIPMAASSGDDSLDGLGSMPVHLIHSPQDEVIPFGPAQETADLLRERGHPVELIRVNGVGHHDMGAYVQPLQEAAKWMWRQWESQASGQ